jgi:hypothetical protein
MIRTVLKPLAVCLAVIVLLMVGATAAWVFAHDLQHAAHHARHTHGTGICAWMCASTGGLITHTFQPAEHAVMPQPVFLAETRPVRFIFPAKLQARAPPVLL